MEKTKKNRKNQAEIKISYKLISWPRNRSKYMVLVSTQQCPGLSTLHYLCVDTPIPVRGLLRGLPRWCEWKYLEEISPPGGAYRITRKGVKFLQKLKSIAPRAVKDWNREIGKWRSIPKDFLKDDQGAWLPGEDAVRLTEVMKFHRKSSPRPTAGRPLSPEGLQKRLNKARKKQQAAIKGLKLLCPRCHGNLLLNGISKKDGHHIWFCPPCDAYFNYRDKSGAMI